MEAIMTNQQANELMRHYNGYRDSKDARTRGIAVGIALALVIMGYDFEFDGNKLDNPPATAVIRRFGRFGGK